MPLRATASPVDSEAALRNETAEAASERTSGNGAPRIGDLSPSIPRGDIRKPMARASISSNRTQTLSSSKRGRPAQSQKLTEVIESTVLFWGITRDPEVRAKVRAQVCRLRRNTKRRYDPRLAAGIIAKRLHIPIIAVDEILQGTIPEFEEWKAIIARAESAAAAVWTKRASA